MTVKDLKFQLLDGTKKVNDNPNNDTRPWIVIAAKNGVRAAICKEILRWNKQAEDEYGDFEVTNEHPTEAEIEEVISQTKK
jgi:hypothetical protein